MNGFIEINVEAFLNRFFIVIGAMIQLAPVQVANTGHLWRVCIDVVNVLIGPANIAS